MKIDITTGQAQIALELLTNELWNIEKQHPVLRNQKRIEAIKAMVKPIAARLLQDGFIDHAYFNAVCN